MSWLQKRSCFSKTSKHNLTIYLYSLGNKRNARWVSLFFMFLNLISRQCTYLVYIVFCSDFVLKVFPFTFFFSLVHLYIMLFCQISKQVPLIPGLLNELNNINNLVISKNTNNMCSSKSVGQYWCPFYGIVPMYLWI